ncbi:MAG: DUF4381 domain-containing protein [Pseudomonadota bacterium]
MDPTQLPLRDLHLPEAVGWWPLAPGWWVLAGCLAILAAWQGYRWLQRRRYLAPQRYALRELAQLEATYLQKRDPVTLGKNLSNLLRRAMLAYAPRDEVAGLTGDAWLEWLDRDLPVPYFHTEGGKSLLELPYRDPHSDLRDVDVNALLAAVRMRLAIPVGGMR